ncbi:MAG: AzlD domain-containing protein [Treponemataceae bacterium]|nr:AzlD domain-containing protein [Treponemataceae bacterium]
MKLNDNLAIYLLIAAITIYLIRMLPLTLIRKDIKNKFLRSFLAYVPYVTLSVMTVPAIIYATGSIYSGIVALVVGVILAFFDGNLFRVALGCCMSVFLTELIMKFIQG